MARPGITEGGQNAIARVDPNDHKVQLFRLPEKEAYANLNTGVFDKSGIYWFTGQSGIYGRLDPKSGDMSVFKSPRGRGTYGITATPAGDIWYASLAGNHIAKIDIKTGNATVVEPPTPNQGARRVWSDSKGRIWVSEWNSGNVSMHDPADGSWKAWKLPGTGSPALMRSMSMRRTRSGSLTLAPMRSCGSIPVTEKFDAFPSDMSGANVRQLAGKPGETWGGESGTNRLVRIQTVA